MAFKQGLTTITFYNMEEVSFIPFSFMEKQFINQMWSAYHLYEKYRGGEDFSIIGRYKAFDWNLVIREASLPLKYLDKFAPFFLFQHGYEGEVSRTLFWVILTYLFQCVEVLWGKSPLLAKESLYQGSFLVALGKTKRWFIKLFKRTSCPTSSASDTHKCMLTLRVIHRLSPSDFWQIWFCESYLGIWTCH